MDLKTKMKDNKKKLSKKMYVFCTLVSHNSLVELVSKERAFPVQCCTTQTKFEGSNFLKCKIGPFRIRKIGTPRIGIFGTLPELAKLGPFRIGENRTLPDWHKSEPSGLAKIGTFRIV